MEKIKKFVNELKETLTYSDKITVFSEKWGNSLYKVIICNANILFTNTIKVIAKWNSQELYRNGEGNYEIIIGF